MARSRLPDLLAAEDLFSDLDMPVTVEMVKGMATTVKERDPLLPGHLLRFLDAFPEEGSAYDPILCDLFLRTIADGGPSLRGMLEETRKKALNAPALENRTGDLRFHDALVNKALNGHGKGASRIFTLLLWHTAQWQVMEDVAKDWVGHWRREDNDYFRDAVINILLSIDGVLSLDGGCATVEALAQAISEQRARVMPDASAYRHAIAHGGFKVDQDGTVTFWTCDALGRTHMLPSLSEDRLEVLFREFRRRLDLLEALSRVVRAWGKHVKPPLSVPDTAV